jgi:hypothetical protein
MRLILLILSLLFLPAFVHAQTATEPNLEWREVKWAFPKSGMETVEVNGIKAYKLGKDMLGVVDSHNGRSIRIITIPASIAVAAELVHRQDPEGMPDVNQFLSALAVMKAVETPEGYNNEPIGSGKLDGETVYLFKTKGGANVGAIVKADRSAVIILPAPSEK